jgi:hypothetical protein
MVLSCDENESGRKVQLYGGMASIDLPARMTNVSDVRPIPDHQEVYTDSHSDQSVLIEILVRFRFLDAAELRCPLDRLHQRFIDRVAPSSLMFRHQRASVPYCY